MNVNDLVQAAINGNIGEVTTLLDNGVNIDGFQNGTCETALMQACRWGREDTVRLLISRGANLNLVSPLRGNTALICACYHKFVPLAELLLRSGADHTLRSHYQNKTALEWCEDAQKRAEIEAIITLLSTESITPPAPPTRTSASNATMIEQLREQLVSMTSERDAFRRDLATANTQRDSAFQQVSALTTERDLLVEDRTRLNAERTQFIEQRDSLQTHLANVRREKDTLLMQLADMRTERDTLLELLEAAQAPGGVVTSSSAFERYRPHMFVPSLVPCSRYPGIHDVSEDSALFRTCNRFCNVGGSWWPAPVPIARFRLVAVQAVVHEEDYYKCFENKQKRITQQRQNGGEFFNFCTGSMDASQLLVLSALREQFLERAPGTAYKAANSFYCYHGPRAEHVRSICTTGMVATRAMDAGFFGCGCYTTLNMEYALRYARGDFDADGGPRGAPGSRYPIIMFAATTGMAYPITPADYGHNTDTAAPAGASDFFGKPLKPGFDCHVVCVSQATNWQAVERTQCQYVEVVIDQQDQLLPVAVLWFEEQYRP